MFQENEIKFYLMLGEKDRLPEALIILTTAVLFYVKGLFSFLSTDSLAGRDLVSNYAFTWLMQKNLMQGEIFRWTNQWLLGFPSFEAYPPFFFIFTSSLNLVTGGIIGLEVIFKIITFLSVFLLPLVTYYSIKPIFGAKKSFFAGFYTLLFIFVYPPISQAYQVFSTGLVAQSFSFLLLIPAIGLMLNSNKRRKIIAGILLGFSALSHPFVAIAGFILSGSMILVEKNMSNAIPGIIGGVIFMPWAITALGHFPYIETYTFAPANTGIFLYLLLPLIIFGGLGSQKQKSLLLSFGTLLFLSIFELPILTQELRFYTYALGIGTLLGGLGANRIYEHLGNNLELDQNLILISLLLPVIGLTLQAGVPQTWDYNGDVSKLFTELESEERGRVIVETSNSSIYDSYVVQAQLPIETKHWAVNDVHLDSSTSSNYILSLESWISKESLYNPICQTCNTSFTKKILSERLDNLGIKYIVARTEESKSILREVASYKGKYGDFWLFENKRGAKLAQKLQYRPIALKGKYNKWKKVNNALFATKFKGEIVWANNPKSNYSKVINMQNTSVDQIISKINQTKLEPIYSGNLSYNITENNIELSTTTPVKIKVSYFPTKYSAAKAGTFNTVIIPHRIEKWGTKDVQIN